MLNILHINSYYTSSGFYKNLYDRQRRTNSTDIYVHGYPWEFENICDKNIIIGNPYTKYERFFFYEKMKKTYNDLKQKTEVEKYHIVHAHTLFSNGVLAYYINRDYHIPYIVAVRNTDINVFFKKAFWLRGLGIKILKNASKIIFISEAYKKQFLDDYAPKSIKGELGKKIIVIPNGIDDFWFEKSNSHKKSKDVIRVLTVGNVNKNKNQLAVCKALTYLQTNNYRVKYTIVGCIQDEKYFDKIRKFPFVEYVKNIPKEVLVNYYSDSDIFVMPSITETFGLTYAEALSQGLPVIYSKGQGFDTQFQEGLVGYHVTSSSIKEIGDTIKQIYNEYDVLTDRCIQNCKQFNWDRINQVYSDLYKKIVEK